MCRMAKTKVQGQFEHDPKAGLTWLTCPGSEKDVANPAGTGIAHLRRPASADEFWLLADWNRSGSSRLFHAGALIGPATVEIPGLPMKTEDETGRIWHVCKFRYFGPLLERSCLIAA